MERIRTKAKPSSVQTLLEFRVSFYTTEGNEKVSACHSENQIYSGSANLKLQNYLRLLSIGMFGTREEHRLMMKLHIDEGSCCNGLCAVNTSCRYIRPICNVVIVANLCTEVLNQH
jgi:hypothetical protein